VLREPHGVDDLSEPHAAEMDDVVAGHAGGARCTKPIYTEALYSGKTAKNSSLFVARLAPNGTGAVRRRCPLCRVSEEVADGVG
jgi:hypothetical protein